MYDKAKIWVEGGAGGNGCVSFRREAHVPRGGPDGGDGGHGGDVVLVCDPSRRDLGALKGSKHFRARRGRHGEGSNRHGARGEDREIPVPPGTQASAVDGSCDRPRRRRAARGRRPRRARRARQQALRHLDPAGAALRREGDRRRGRLDRAAAEAARRRRPDRAAERRQVLAAGPADAGGAEGRRLPVHDDLAGAGDDRGRGPPGGRRRHPRADRRRRRGRRPRPRVPRPRRALRDARPPRRPGAARGRPGRQLRDGARRARRPRRRASTRLPELVVLSKRDLLPRRARSRRRSRSGGERLGDRALGVLAVSSATGEGLDELRQRILAELPEAPAPRRTGAGAGDEFEAEHRVYRPAGEGGYSVEREDDGGFRVLGRGVELLFERHDTHQRRGARLPRAAPQRDRRRRRPARAPASSPATTSASASTSSSCIL